MIRKIIQLISSFPLVSARTEEQFYEDMETWVVHGANTTVNEQNQLKIEINNTVDDINVAVEEVSNNTQIVNQAKDIVLNAKIATIQAKDAAQTITTLAFTDLSNNDMLKYNATLGKWVNIKQGSGNGLDADSIDGKHSSDLMHVSYWSSDLNFMQTAGSFKLAPGLINLPNNTDFGNMLVLSSPDSDTFCQLVMSHDSQDIYWRGGIKQVGMQPWRRILSDANALTTTALGYASGVGVGGMVYQDTNKNTPVTLNKLCGKIITSNSYLAPNDIASFIVNNNTLGYFDSIELNFYVDDWNVNYSFYNCWAVPFAGGFIVLVKNISDVGLSNPLSLIYSIKRGTNT